MCVEKRTNRLWAGALVCFLTLTSVSGFGAHDNSVIYNNMAEAKADPIFLCNWYDPQRTPHFGFLPDSPMPYYDCVAAAQ